MQLTDKHIDDFQKIYKEKFGVDLDKQTAFNKAHQLYSMVKTLSDSDREEQFRLQRLKREPAGFAFPTGKQFSCPICHEQITGENAWYDKCGMKCMTCQEALNNGVLPRFVFTDRHSWYSFFDFERKFNLSEKEVRKFMESGHIKATAIPTKNGRVYKYIFLKRDNPKLAELDPNTLPSGIRKIHRRKAALRAEELGTALGL